MVAPTFFGKVAVDAATRAVGVGVGVGVGAAGVGVSAVGAVGAVGVVVGAAAFQSASEKINENVAKNVIEKINSEHARSQSDLSLSFFSLFSPFSSPPPLFSLISKTGEKLPIWPFLNPSQGILKYCPKVVCIVRDGYRHNHVTIKAKK